MPNFDLKVVEERRMLSLNKLNELSWRLMRVPKFTRRESSIGMANTSWRSGFKKVT